MPLVDSSLIPLALYFALGGTLLSLVLLMLEYRAPKLADRCTLFGGVGLLLLATATWLLGAGWEFAVPAALLGVAALGAAGMRSAAVQHFLLRLLRPRLVWGLILAASVGVAAWIPGASEPPVDKEAFALPSASGFHFLEGIVAVTDAGRELPLCAYDDSDSLFAEESDILALSQYQHQVIRLGEPQTQCNCHGWIYAAGKYAIRSRDVSTILEDNGYAAVVQPEAGDLAIYRSTGDEVTHTGLVRLVGSDGSIFVESKWGPLGIYLHPVATQPYGDRHTFYRSPREGHLVAVTPRSSAPAADSTLAQMDVLSLDASETVLSAARPRPGIPQIYDRPVVKVPGQRKT